MIGRGFSFLRHPSLPAPGRAALLMDQAVFSGGSFLLSILLARGLGVGAFGQFSGLLLGLYLAASICSALVVQPFQVQSGGNASQPSYLAFTFWAQLALSASLGGLYALAKPLLGFSLPLWAVLPFGMGFVFQDYARRAMLALGRPLAALALDGSSVAAQLLALHLFFGQGDGALPTLLGHLGAAYLVPAGLALYFFKPLHFDGRAWRHFAAQHLKQGQWLLYTALVQWWSSNLFVVASGLYLGTAALGALRLAQSLFGALNLLLQLMENHVLPQTAIRLPQGQAVAFAYLGSASRRAGLLFLPVLAAAFAFAEPIMQVAGGQAYLPYAFVLRGMAVLYVFIYLSQPIRIAIRVLLLNRAFFYGYLASLAMALVSSRPLLSAFGLMGAIAGLIAAQVLLIAFWQYTLNKKNSNPWKSFISY
jgi:O-antigen/teichoic acid export membrane protein